jgi:uncharacterized integral membrane protein
MKSRGILLTVLLVLVALFAAINWATLSTPLPVDLLLLRVEIPVGLVLLSVTAGLALVFFAGALFDRAGQLQEIRRLEKQLDRARAKLDEAQASELAQLNESLQAWGASLERRIDDRVGAAETRLEEALQDREGRDEERAKALEQRVLTVRNELAADVGEAEDLIRRMLGPTADALPDEVP